MLKFVWIFLTCVVMMVSYLPVTQPMNNGTHDEKGYSDPSHHSPEAGSVPDGNKSSSARNESLGPSHRVGASGATPKKIISKSPHVPGHKITTSPGKGPGSLHYSNPMKKNMSPSNKASLYNTQNYSSASQPSSPKPSSPHKSKKSIQILTSP
jgi:hypothetical protein